MSETPDFPAPVAEEGDSTRRAAQSARDYAFRRARRLERQLGRGGHGSVYSTTEQTAIKAHRAVESYTRESACYKRLNEQNVDEVRGHHVPQLVAWDEALLVIEMTIVTPPFLLDFGGAYLDWPPEFSEDAIAQWQIEKGEQFGQRWPAVQRILAVLGDAYGIFVTDVNPGNIMFDDA